MNMQNISALVKQLELLGFEDVSYPLLKRISFKPNSFYLSQRIERGKDLLSLQIFFEKKRNDEVYELAYYDAVFQQEINFSDTLINGVDITSLEKQMSGIDWRKAFELDEKKAWTADDKSSWEKEQKIESIIGEILALETTGEGKIVAAALKLKYWEGSLYHLLFDKIVIPKIKAEISQRFYFSNGQDGISIDEAYRFLLNRRLGMQLLAKKRQIESPHNGEQREVSNNSTGSGLPRKKKINSAIRSKKNKPATQ